MSSCLFLSGVLGRKKPSKDLSPRALGSSCFVCKLSHLFFRSISQMLSKNLEEYFCFWGVTFIFQEYLAGASKQKISENLGDESFCLQAVIFIFQEYLAGTNEQKISENLGDESLCLQAVTFVFQEYLAGTNKQKIWGIVALFASCHICFSGVSGRSKEEKDHQDPWGQVQTFLAAGPHQLCGAGSPRWHWLPRLFPVHGTEDYFVCLLLKWNTGCQGHFCGQVCEWMRC